MTDREERLMRAPTRIAEAEAMVCSAGADLPPDCDATIKVLERNARSLCWAAVRIRRELERADATGRDGTIEPVTIATIIRSET